MLVKVLEKIHTNGRLIVNTEKVEATSLNEARRKLMRFNHTLAVVDADKFTYLDTIRFLTMKGYLFYKLENKFVIKCDTEEKEITKNELHLFGMKYCSLIEDFTEEELEEIQRIKEYIGYSTILESMKVRF